jgi:hypothetical protein
MSMSKQAKIQYLEAVRIRYLNSNRTDKSLILRELCEVCGYHRKHAIRALNEGIWRIERDRCRDRPKGKPGRKAQYANDYSFCTALKGLWLITDQMCAPNLKSAIPEWLPAWKEERSVSAEVESKLLQVSAPTIGRILQPSKYRTKKRGGTKPGSLLRTEIPIRTNFWEVDGPGFMEGDTVAHCGGSMSGEFAWTLTVTDIDTTWTENRAVWNKLAVGVRDGIQDIELHLPFLLRAFDSDNGAEFINHALVHYFSGKFVQFTRSREYHKNDNAHVEQKNWSHPRQLWGELRIDCPAAIALMNDLYRNEWSLLRNHFYPCLKLEEKYRIQSRVRRRYLAPQTPYQRVLASPKISEEKKQELRTLHSSLNPIKLKRTVDEKARKIIAIIRQAHLATLAS